MKERLSEPQIVRGLQNGDPDAWAALCDQYSVRLWRCVARLIGGDEAVVADVFQETMLAVARAGRNLSDNTRLWAWLATIGHNQAALHWRRSKHTNADPLPTSISDGRASPETVLCEQDNAAAVRRLLLEMNADYVSVLTAKYIDGLTIAEIVATFGGTEESVRSRLARARRDFRARYEVRFPCTDQTAVSDAPTRIP